MKLSEIMQGIKCELLFDAEITGITDKPENVKPGSAFVCISGSRFDGHDSAAIALSKGCAAVICTRDTGTTGQIRVEDARLALSCMLANFYRRDTEKIKLIGITGTNGKTSTSFFIRHILENSGKKTGLIGTLGAQYDGEIYSTDMTTPEPEVLYRTVADMAETGCEYCVAEVSSQALAQHRCASLFFETAVFTNLGRDHLDYHKSTDEYIKAKAMLFAQSGKAVLNADDAAAEFMAKGCAGEIMRYSAKDSSAEMFAKNIKLLNDSVQYTLVSPLGSYPVRVPVIGRFTVYNTLAAICAAYLSGVSPGKASKALAKAVSAPGRAERLMLDTPYSVYIDYAHTPAALECILKTLSELTKNRLITVFGCGGDRDREKRPLMGSAAVKYSDIIILTDDNPRTEDPEGIIEDIKCGTGSASVLVERDRKKAISLALSEAQSGDLVLIAGKGREKYQLIGNDKIPFGDAEAVYTLLKDK